MVTKPEHLFGRTAEWDGLVAFATRPVRTGQLGIVSGRRRMGKTYLLRALVERLGGFYFGATTATGAESLRQFGTALSEFTGAGAPMAFDNWDHAITYLFGIGAGSRAEQPTLMVID